MAFELRTEKLSAWEMIADISTSTIVENDIIVPDIKPDISRVIIFDGECRVVSVETMYGRVVVNCKNRYKVIYLSENEENFPRSIENISKVSFAIDIPEARSGMESEVDCKIEHLEYQILNSRKLGAKAVISTKLQIRKENVKELANNIEGVSEVQFLRGLISVKSCQNREYIEEPIRESFELPAGKPAIREILRSDIRISNKKVREYEGKIQVGADVVVSTLYAADDETYSLNSMENAFEFFKEIEIDSEESISDFDLFIQPSLECCEAGEDSDGEKRVIDVDAVLLGYVRLYTEYELENISDAYVVGQNLSVDRKIDSLDNIVFRNNGQIFIKDQIDKNSLDYELAGVFNVISDVEQISVIHKDGALNISGVVLTDLIGASTDAEVPIFSQKFRIPFSHKIDYMTNKSQSTYKIDGFVDSTSYSLGALGNVEVRVVLEYNIVEQNKIVFSTIHEISEEEANRFTSDNDPSIIVYFAQKDDTLWEVAKKYNTTIADLRELNEIEENIDLNGLNLVVKCGK